MTGPAPVDPDSHAMLVDPSDRTTRQLSATIAALRDLVFSRMETVERGLEDRFRAIKVLSDERMGALTDRMLQQDRFNEQAREGISGRIELLTKASDTAHATLDAASRGRWATVQAMAEQRHTDVDRRFATISQRMADDFKLQTEQTNTAITATEKSIVAAMDASDRAVSKSETSNERRFDAVNEFRGQLNDMIARLMPRGEADARINAVGDKLDQLFTRIDRREGSGEGMKQGWTTLVAALGGLAAVVAVFVGIANYSSRGDQTATIQRQLDSLQQELALQRTAVKP